MGFLAVSLTQSLAEIVNDCAAAVHIAMMDLRLRSGTRELLGWLDCGFIIDDFSQGLSK